MPNSDQLPEKKTTMSPPVMVALLVGILLLAVAAFVGILLLNRFEEMETKVTELTQQVEETIEKSDQALLQSEEAEASAVKAARARVRAESEAELAQDEAERARQQMEVAEVDADNAREEARIAQEEAERIKQEWEAEVNRLEDALSHIVETRKTALGLVLNLSEEYLKFDFDKADLRPANRELLSRIAGILLTSKDYSIAVYGHTDDVGTEEYNQKLSERRAAVVRDYLVESGLDPAIVSLEGFGKTQPLVPEKTEEARAKNRRVEIGIINTRINYNLSK